MAINMMNGMGNAGAGVAQGMMQPQYQQPTFGGNQQYGGQPQQQPQPPQGDIPILDAPPPPLEAYGWAQVQATLERICTRQDQLFAGQEQIQQSLSHLTQRVDYLYDYQYRRDCEWRSWQASRETGHSSHSQPDDQPEDQPEGQPDEERDDMQQD